MPASSRKRWCAVSDELYTGPTVLQPRRVVAGDEMLGRWLIGPLATLFLIVVLVFYVFFSPHKVDGDSMAPSLQDGDRTLVTHSYDDPKRGDIIVFTAINENDEREDLVKRIVAVAGDTVEVQSGIATVNGVVEDTPEYFPDPNDPLVVSPIEVPPGYIFVMGDNRPVSLDSRRIGFVPLGSAVGKVCFVWAPVNRMRAVR